MKTVIKFAAVAALSMSAMFSAPAIAQQGSGRAIVSLYQGVPGHQEALAKWMADQDRIAVAAGVQPSQLYVHTDGDSWDFMIIQPVTTEVQDQAMEAAAARLRLPTGPRASLEFRKHIQSHTDTFVRGPMTATQYLQSLGPRR